MTFQVLTVMSMQKQLSGIWRRVVSLKYTDVSELRTASIITLMGTVRTSETSVYFNETTRLYIPEGCHLHPHL